MGPAKHHHQYHDHVLVRLKGVFQHQNFKIMNLLGIHPGHLFFQTFAIGKDQIFTQQNTGCRANRIKGLADVQAQRGMAFRADHRTVGVRCRLEKAQADGDRENRGQEHGVGCHVRSREKERTADDIKRQPRENSDLIAGVFNH